MTDSIRVIALTVGIVAFGATAVAAETQMTTEECDACLDECESDWQACYGDVSPYEECNLESQRCRSVCYDGCFWTRTCSTSGVEHVLLRREHAHPPV